MKHGDIGKAVQESGKSVLPPWNCVGGVGSGRRTFQVYKNKGRNEKFGAFLKTSNEGWVEIGTIFSNFGNDGCG